jgi:2-haloalkanoic acid dehalogenase type II
MHFIRAICFDLDNTLWDVMPPLLRAEHAVYEFLKARYPKIPANLTMEAMRAARERVMMSHPHMNHDFSFMRKQALRDHASEYGYPESLAEEAFEIFLHARNQIELYEEVLPVLELLRRKYRLFSASNGNADLKRIGLAHLFERSVAARDVGALKPHAAVFLKVLEATGLEPREVLFVGDDPEHDVEGARRAGMHAVWVNRAGTAWPSHFDPPPYSVKSLHDLAELLSLDPVPAPARPQDTGIDDR